MEALLFGQLSEVDGCLRVQDSNGVTSYLIIWPPAVKLRITRESIAILNDADAVIMQVGDIIRLSGGTLETVAQLESRQLLSQPIPAHCAGPYWVVGEEMARISR